MAKMCKTHSSKFSDAEILILGLIETSEQIEMINET